jgi:RimJ/RimL family protein N-acetyltransferase
MNRVRQLARENAPAYHALRLRMLREYPDAFTSSYEEDCLKPLSWVEARLTASAEPPHKFVLGAFSQSDELVGSIGLAVEERLKERHKALVFGMFVAPEAAGHGVGRSLLKACIERARTIPDLEQLQLTVTASNVRTLRLYIGAGFRSFAVEERAIRVAGAYYPKAHLVRDLRAPPPEGGPP